MTGEQIDALGCPFCGGKPTLLAFTEQDGFVRSYAVRCDECAIEQEAEYESDAIAAWNRRAAPTKGDVLMDAERLDLLERSFHIDGTGSEDVYAAFVPICGDGTCKTLREAIDAAMASQQETK